MADDSILIEVCNPLDAAETARIIEILRRHAPGAPAIVDVRAVDEFEDHLIVQIANAIAAREGSGSFVGLSRHHTRVMRYIGIASKLK